MNSAVVGQPSELPLTRPSGTLSPSEEERDEVEAAWFKGAMRD